MQNEADLTRCLPANAPNLWEVLMNFELEADQLRKFARAQTASFFVQLIQQLFPTRCWWVFYPPNYVSLYNRFSALYQYPS